MDDEALAAYADAVSAAIGLPIPPEYRANVIANLKIILNQSAPLMALTFADTEESAPVFRA
ncbi:MAG: DUF4089 domain-containing protein [Hyphomonadaceae bacterium]